LALQGVILHPIEWYKYQFKYAITFLELLKNNENLEIRRKAPKELKTLGVVSSNSILKEHIEECLSFDELILWLEEFINGKHIPDYYIDFPMFMVEKDNIKYKVRLTHLKKTGYVNCRKNANASSNFYEAMTAYYLINGSKVCENTGIIYWNLDEDSEKELVFDDIKKLYIANKGNKEDLKVAKQNSEMIKKDIGDKKISKVYWSANYKPNNIDYRNPSDIILLLENGEYCGYSLKKLDKNEYNNPIINTGLVCLWREDYIDLSDKIKDILKKSFDILIAKYNLPIPEKYIYTEQGMHRYFKDIFNHKEICLDYRRMVKDDIVNFLNVKDNLVAFLNKIKYRIYGDDNTTKCPYKLIYANESGATVFEIDEKTLIYKVLNEAKDENISDILINNKYNSQGFDLSFTCLGYLVCFKNIVIRSRFGGMKGLDLYITFTNISVKN